MIKSFQELNTNRFTILLEENPLSNIYNEIVLTDDQEKKITEIILGGQSGDMFNIKCRKERLIIEDYIDLQED